jgi:hypothetical protein
VSRLPEKDVNRSYSKLNRFPKGSPCNRTRFFHRLELRSLELLPTSQIGGRTFNDVAHGRFETVSDASRVELFLAS